MLKISVSTSESWSAQPLKTQPVMLSGPAALQRLKFCSDLLTFTGVTLEGQLTWWRGKLDARRGITILQTTIKGVEGIRKRCVRGVSFVIVYDVLDAPPHAPGVVGGEVTLDFESIGSLGPLHT